MSILSSDDNVSFVSTRRVDVNDDAGDSDMDYCPVDDRDVDNETIRSDNSLEAEETEGPGQERTTGSRGCVDSVVEHRLRSRRVALIM